MRRELEGAVLEAMQRAGLVESPRESDEVTMTPMHEEDPGLAEAVFADMPLDNDAEDMALPRDVERTVTLSTTARADSGGSTSSANLLASVELRRTRSSQMGGAVTEDDSTTESCTHTWCETPWSFDSLQNSKFKYFFHLPLEIRQQIYRALLAKVFKNHQWPWYNYPSKEHIVGRVICLRPDTNEIIELTRSKAKTRIGPNPLAFLLACKQMHAEGQQMLHESTIFDVRFQQQAEFLSIKRTWENKPSSMEILSHARHLQITTKLIDPAAPQLYNRRIREILKPCDWDANLRTLRLDVAMSGNPSWLHGSAWNTNKLVGFNEDFGNTLRRLARARDNRPNYVAKREALVVAISNAVSDVEGMNELVKLRDELAQKIVVKVEGRGSNQHWT
jgi:hypothetical protein